MKKKKKNIFQRLWRIIDLKIVIPTTRLILKVAKTFDKFEKKAESFLSRQNNLLFVSLFIALLTFIVIDQKLVTFTNQSAEILKDQKIEATYNEEAYVIEGLPETVDITLMGNRSDLFIARQSANSKVKVDLSNLKTGTHKVNIEYSQPFKSIKYSVNPSIATVNIYAKVSKTKTLTTDLLNQDSLDDKLIINNTNPEISEVVIKGTDDKNAVNSLTKVSTVKALVDVESIAAANVGITTIKDVPLKAYDKNGNILDIEIVPSKINVDIEIQSPSKVVPIRVIPKGEIGFGKAISTINMNQQKTVVYGNKTVLDNLEYVPVEVDVSGLKEDKEYKLDITKPKGVKSMSVSTVTLRFTLDNASTKNIENINIDVRNLGDNYIVQGNSAEDIKVTVNAKGVQSVLANLNSEDINAYIDLKNYKAGEYEVPVEVEGTDSRVILVSKTKKVKIKIIEK